LPKFLEGINTTTKNKLDAILENMIVRVEDEMEQYVERLREVIISYLILILNR
jgi:hypothetical protein